MSKLLLKELRTCRAKAAEAEAAERRPRSRARKRDDEGDATSEAEAAEEEGDAVDKRAEAAEEDGVYIREWYFKKRAASAGGTSPAPLRPRHHRDTSSTVTIAASQECEPGVVREQDTRCQECQSEGSQDILELPEGEQCSAPPISSSSTAERSVPIFKMDPEVVARSKAEPYVRTASAKQITASGIERRPQMTWPPGVAWWHGTSLDGRYEQAMFRKEQARAGPNKSVGPPSLYDVWSKQKWETKGGVWRCRSSPDE